MEEIEHDCTDEIVCPHCGYEMMDSYEMDDDDGEIECYECSKLFHYQRSKRIWYSTVKVE